ncbi:MAG: hypothetical protein H8K07_05175 [Nitrospira sp.]|jgi:hypothetical protein|nr:hypothetical protein [Nitrospira sp.]
MAAMDGTAHRHFRVFSKFDQFLIKGDQSITDRVWQISLIHPVNAVPWV